MNVCNHSCHHFSKNMFLANIYDKGYVFCKCCKVYFKYEGIRCPCCSTRLRHKSRHTNRDKRLYKEKQELKILKCL